MMFALFLVVPTFVSGAPTVRTTNGTIAGSLDGGVATFLGIPFASAPIGNLRFLNPTVHPGWSNVRDATVAGATCIQGSQAPPPPPGPPTPPSPCTQWCSAHGHSPDECGCGVCGSFGHCTFSCTPDNKTRFRCPSTDQRGATHKSPIVKPINSRGEASEDCLFLNAFVPAAALNRSASDPLLPIMFYIHGGGFVSGSAPSTPSMAALTGHVVFATQYRLGVFGFFSTEQPPTNLGLADQRLALRWVRDNAEFFGGDPNRIIIFGCSAGGASVAGMLTMPDAYGLYQAAGIESPGGHQGWMVGTQRYADDWTPPSFNKNMSDTLATELGCTGPGDLECLQKLTTSAVYAPSLKLHFAPALAVEGQYPLGQIAKGEWNKVPVIIGGQSCESCGVAESMLGPYTRDGVTDAQFRAALVKAGFSGENGSPISPDMLVAWYANRIETEGRWRTFARINSDSGHACSSTLHANALSTWYANVWRYYFAYAPTGQGATHGGDETWLLGEHENGTPGEVTLSHNMALWWASLGSDGNPNTKANKGAPIWPKYNASNAPGTMYLGDLKNPTTFINTTIDTVRIECEHWKPYLGWAMP